jgi:hypothetical protein
VSDHYTIDRTIYGYVVTGPAGDTSICPTEEAAKADIKRSKKNDETFLHARLLVDTAIEVQSLLLGMDYETAKRWIKIAADVMD